MTGEKIHNQLKSIKRSFHLLMNGAVACSMREKGLEYKTNWGIQLPDIKKMAEEYGKDYSLAKALWEEDTRECKILATLIMPATEMPRALVDIWIGQTTTQEIAEMAAFNLYRDLDYAHELAYEWIVAENRIKQLSGFQLLAGLFAKGWQPDKSSINIFIDRAQAILETDDPILRHAATNCIRRFCGLGNDFEYVVRKHLCNVFNR